MNYEELVNALRHCVSDEKGVTKCAGCPYYPDITGCMDRLHTDAAAAIETLQAELEKKRAADCWGCKCEKVEPKRGEWVVFNKQMLINLENAREQYKELGYPHRTELGLQCSNCRKVTYVDSGIKYEFCPHCGAKMEVQE